MKLMPAKALLATWAPAMMSIWAEVTVWEPESFLQTWYLSKEICGLYYAKKQRSQIENQKPSSRHDTCKKQSVAKITTELSIGHSLRTRVHPHLIRIWWLASKDDGGLYHQQNSTKNLKVTNWGRKKLKTFFCLTNSMLNSSKRPQGSFRKMRE